MTELVAVTGRPMVHDLRATLDAILTRYGAAHGELFSRLAAAAAQTRRAGATPRGLAPAAALVCRSRN
ncbi:hypothetical protein ACWEOI_31035 [Nocardia sp. NPDC004340]